MDKQRANEIRTIAQATLDALGTEIGMKISIKNGTFDAGQITFKVEFAEIGESGMAETKEVTDFRNYASSYGLKADDLGRQFTMRGESFEVCGLKPRARKMPILAKRTDGRTFKFAADDVKRLLEAGAA